ncbi:MAG TPA: response regulator [Bryobacteraceae bacterium]|jgi:two-component system, chemotaxis family, chemotaxis protein CheY|nr:response regulator [Bryobacteraceae bacterium]
MTVLIVDDSPVMRNFIRRVMRLAGFGQAEYLEASDGSEALRCARAAHIDLVLTDINMPGMNGEDLLAALHADPALRAIPAVVVSTDATLDRQERTTALGARGYLAKPFSPETLRDEIERALEPRR